jgi:Kdo2-lipid IVA lauroyltransferase/acyltransferase
MPKLERARLWAECALVRTAAGLLRLLPIEVGASLAARLVSWAAPWTAFHRRALRNLATAFPDWSEAERERVAAAMWRNTGRTFAETLQLDRIFSNCSRIEMTGHGALEQCLREPGANVGVTLHMGNWEIVSFAVGLCGARVAGVYRPLRNPYLDRYLRLMREPFYPGGLLGKGRARGELPLRSVAIAAKKLLRNGGHIGLVCDQVDNGSSFTVPFFSQQATFTAAPAVFARGGGARIWIARCLRIDRRSHFLVEIKELPVERTSDRTADLRDTTAAIARQFECWIRDAPEQWMWWQRRSISG